MPAMGLDQGPVAALRHLGDRRLGCAVALGLQQGPDLITVLDDERQRPAPPSTMLRSAALATITVASLMVAPTVAADCSRTGSP